MKACLFHHVHHSPPRLDSAVHDNSPSAESAACGPTAALMCSRIRGSILGQNRPRPVDIEELPARRTHRHRGTSRALHPCDIFLPADLLFNHDSNIDIESRFYPVATGHIWRLPHCCSYGLSKPLSTSVGAWPVPWVCVPGHQHCSQSLSPPPRIWCTPLAHRRVPLR